MITKQGYGYYVHLMDSLEDVTSIVKKYWKRYRNIFHLANVFSQLIQFQFHHFIYRAVFMSSNIPCQW